jgi:hypothetical protein
MVGSQLFLIFSVFLIFLRKETLKKFGDPGKTLLRVKFSPFRLGSEPQSGLLRLVCLSFSSELHHPLMNLFSSSLGSNARFRSAAQVAAVRLDHTAPSPEHLTAPLHPAARNILSCPAPRLCVLPWLCSGVGSLVLSFPYAGCEVAGRGPLQVKSIQQSAYNLFKRWIPTMAILFGTPSRTVVDPEPRFGKV